MLDRLQGILSLGSTPVPQVRLCAAGPRTAARVGGRQLAVRATPHYPTLSPRRRRSASPCCNPSTWPAWRISYGQVCNPPRCCGGLPRRFAPTDWPATECDCTAGRAQNIVCMCGAGISVSAGIPGERGTAAAAAAACYAQLRATPSCVPHPAACYTLLRATPSCVLHPA